MRRLIAALAVVLVCGPLALAQTPAEFAQTADFASSLQNKDGGFAPAPGQPSTLGSTSTALRILHYVGGSIPDVLGCVKFVKSCEADGGGFAQTPGGEPDSLTTSFGLMAAAELKIADKAMIDRSIAYFHDHAKELEQVRLAIAALEAVHAKSPDFDEWLKRFHETPSA